MRDVRTRSLKEGVNPDQLAQYEIPKVPVPYSRTSLYSRTNREVIRLIAALDRMGPAKRTSEPQVRREVRGEIMMASWMAPCRALDRM